MENIPMIFDNSYFRRCFFVITFLFCYYFHVLVAQRSQVFSDPFVDTPQFTIDNILSILVAYSFYKTDLKHNCSAAFTTESQTFNRNSTLLYTQPEEVMNLKLFYDQHNGSHWKWRNTTVINTAIRWNFTNFNNVSTYRGNVGSGTIPSDSGNATDFNSDPCLDNWQGISCTNDTQYLHIESIGLKSYDIPGRIPDYFFQNLTYLRTLDLSKNQLSGTIFNISTNPILLEVELGYNFRLHGSLNVSNFPKSIMSLSLDSLQLYTTIPADINRLQKLQSLDLFNSTIHGTIPDSFFQLPELCYLDLGYNQISGTISLGFNRLTHLQEFSLGQNYLTGTIPELWNMTSELRALELYENMLHGTIPSFVAKCDKLLAFTLISNQIHGPIPTNLLDLKHLLVLFIGFNQLTGTIPQPHHHRSILQGYELDGNYLTGFLPEFSNMRHLLLFFASENHLGGSLPKTIRYLSSVLFFVVIGSNITGSLPAEISNCTNLLYLYLSENQLTGTIPAAAFQGMDSLYRLDLSYNQLIGTIPSLTNNTKLVQITLSGNQLNGSIPRFEGLNRLLYVSLQENQLSGTVVVINSSRLGFIDLSNNRLHGTIPSDYGGKHMLANIRFSGNKLTGSIPASFRRLVNLQVLLLLNNHLSGHIDGFFNVSSQKHLTTVDLGYNRFSGTIPSDLFHLVNLNLISIGQNCFHGSLPGSICDATQLQQIIFDGLTSGESCVYHYSTAFGYFHPVSSSFMSGSLPECMWTLPKLRVLHISGNGLRGTIPSSVGSAQSPFQSNLTDVVVSHNRLSGTLPSWFQSHSMTNLDMSFNKFVGHIGGMTTFDQINTTISQMILKLNRFTGKFPPNLVPAQSIDALEGNIFDCEHDLPNHDPNKDTYICGSNQYNDSFVVFGTIMGFVILLVMVLYFLSFHSTRTNLAQAISLRFFYCLEVVRYCGRFLWIVDQAEKIEQIELQRKEQDHVAVDIEMDEIPANSDQDQDHEHPRSSWNRLTSWLPRFGSDQCLDLDPVEMESWARIVRNSQMANTTTFLRSLSLIQRVSVIISLWAIFVCLPFYLLMYNLPGNFVSYQDQYLWVTTSVFLSGVVSGGVLLSLCVAISLYSMSMIYRKWTWLFQLNKAIRSVSLEMANMIKQMNLSAKVVNPQAQSTDSSEAQSVENPLQYHSTGEFDDKKGDIEKEARSMPSTRSEIKPPQSSSQGRHWNLSVPFALCAVVIVNISLVLVMNIGYVIIVSNSKLSPGEYYLFQALMGLAKFIWNMGVLPFLLSHFSKGSYLAILHLSLLVFNNIVAPMVSLAFFDPQCFHSFFFGASSINTSYQIEICTFIFPQLGDNQYVQFNCFITSTETFTTSYQPTFIYYNVCGSNLLRYYVPVYTYKYLIVLVLYPSILFYIGFSKSRWFYGALLKFFSPLLRPQSRKQTLRLNPQLIQVNIVNHIVMLLTFGLNAPLFTLICVLVICVTSFIWQLSVIRYLKYDSRDAPFLGHEVPTDNFASLSVSISEESSSTLNRATEDRDMDLSTKSNASRSTWLYSPNIPHATHVCILNRATLSRHELLQETQRMQALEEVLFEKGNSLRSSFLVIVLTALIFNGLICADIIGDKAGQTASLWTIVGTGCLIFALLLWIRFQKLITPKGSLVNRLSFFNTSS